MTLEEICAKLRANECLILPSDTIYGIAARAYSNSAIQKVFEIKERPTTKHIPIHFHSLEQMANDIEITPIIEALCRKFLPGPLTIIANKIPTSKIKTASPTLGVRIPKHALLLEILEKLEEPITMTSANKHGKEPAAAFLEIQSQLELQGVEDDKSITNQASTIIDATQNEIILIREGPISIHQIHSLFNNT